MCQRALKSYLPQDGAQITDSLIMSPSKTQNYAMHYADIQFHKMFFEGKLCESIAKARFRLEKSGLLEIALS